jgi:acyl dehydratase
MPRAYFDDFEAGQFWGTDMWAASADVCAQWTSTFTTGRSSSQTMPAALAQIPIAQSVQSLLKDKPPGGVHVNQVLEFHAPISIGDVLTTELRIEKKYLKRERRYVEIETRTRNQSGELVLSGLRTTIWAA